ncbi:UNVERIFIED_CONTAM: RNA-binding protein 39 [Sesamum radiatum]|uniref:RNA-binding protein 39 n=1 Tax=Sesamum radiatum TaxID=300843 RepID=A0AAW2VS33_SESRA
MFGRRFKDKKEAVEPEADPERDQRTVFAYQMPLKATERDVFEFFSQAGKVRDVKLIMDRNSRRSKGVGSGLAFSTVSSISFNSGVIHHMELMRYIEFYDAMSVPMAIALSGHLFLGQPVMVKPSEAEKNLVQSNTSAGGAGVAGPYGATDRKLYVGNLHFNMTEFQLKQIFEAFGPVELVQLPTDPETGHCKGFGFVQTDPEFDLDIRDDVQEECSKYGRVKHIHVDKNSAGYVYLRFESVEAASRAQQAMHKRWFARRLISAIFLQPYEYDAKFKGTA